MGTWEHGTGAEWFEELNPVHKWSQNGYNPYMVIHACVLLFVKGFVVSSPCAIGVSLAIHVIHVK